MKNYYKARLLHTFSSLYSFLLSPKNNQLLWNSLLERHKNFYQLYFKQIIDTGVSQHLFDIYSRAIEFDFIKKSLILARQPEIIKARRGPLFGLAAVLFQVFVWVSFLCLQSILKHLPSPYSFYKELLIFCDFSLKQLTLACALVLVNLSWFATAKSGIFHSLCFYGWIRLYYNNLLIIRTASVV